MGLFNRNAKNEKEYTYKEVIKMMKTPGYENYVAIPVGEKYFFIPEQREEKINEREAFVNSISGNGAYANNKSYNNYQSAKRYNPGRGFGAR